MYVGKDRLYLLRNIISIELSSFLRISQNIVVRKH